LIDGLRPDKLRHGTTLRKERDEVAQNDTGDRSEDLSTDRTDNQTAPEQPIQTEKSHSEALTFLRSIEAEAPQPVLVGWHGTGSRMGCAHESDPLEGGVVRR
jgi:hypothetical protein